MARKTATPSSTCLAVGAYVACWRYGTRDAVEMLANSRVREFEFKLSNSNSRMRERLAVGMEAPSLPREANPALDQPHDFTWKAS